MLGISHFILFYDFNEQLNKLTLQPYVYRY